MVAQSQSRITPISAVLRATGSREFCRHGGRQRGRGATGLAVGPAVRAGGTGKRESLKYRWHGLKRQGQACRDKGKTEAFQTRACTGVSGGGRFL